MKVTKVVFLALTCTSCMSGFQSLTPDQYQTAMQRPGVVMVDVRTPEEYAAGHIPGAYNINLQQPHFSKTVRRQLDKQQPVLLNCKGGVRSKKAAKKLARRGYKVSELDKGFAEWQKQGKPVTTQPTVNQNGKVVSGRR